MDTQQEVLLFVKAGDDGKRYGACPFCQRLFMILLAKSSLQQLQFKVATYLDDTFPTPSLDYDDVDADKCCRDVFQKFCYYVKDVSKDSSQLDAELAKINEVLASRTSHYLCGDHMTHLDFELLPKLHQIRVAANALKGYEISPKLRHLWAYIARAYNDDLFTQACPPDQEIIVHWADKPETPNLTMEQKARLARELPKYSFDLPISSP
ncbi:chloride intracellular channel exl-1 [Caerostris darwini]|uniref:Chloride intracellular channel exl-1 n=1 Tax=Caerostris darwini TaxID=1538125 RepID=A0AAV4UGC7_9ARAC|nr:chloride intracellular channel exl-1 [Caerostris darwini]